MICLKVKFPSALCVIDDELKLSTTVKIHARVAV